MGLDVRSKCLDSNQDISCGYIAYNRFIEELVRVAYGEELGSAFHDEIRHIRNFTEEEINKWNSICNKDLDLLIFHSDCDGKFTWQECGRIYKAMKDLKSDMMGHSYGNPTTFNVFEHWKEMFRLCWKHKNTMYYC